MHVIATLIALLGSPNDASASACRGTFDRGAVIACARANSPRIRAEAAKVSVLDGKIDAARVMLPSNPRLSVTVADRTNPAGARALNVSGTLSQELEIAGQRRKRRARGLAERDQASAEVEVTSRDVEAAALVAYYDVLAARQELEIVETTFATSKRLEAVAAGRAEAGLAAPLDVDLAAGRRARLQEEVALARGRVEIARAQLAGTMGLDPTVPLSAVRGLLRPIPMPSSQLGDLTRTAMQRRPELASLAASRKTALARVNELKRDRAPNPSLSFFVQSDGFDERVIGAGVSIPIPLPAPLGRTNRGRISAARAQVRSVDAQVDAKSRDALMEVAVAHHALHARRRALEAYPDEATERARSNMAEVAGEIETGRLPVRDALIAQQSLLEVLLRRMEAEHQLCLASVELARAVGLDFEGGAS